MAVTLPACPPIQNATMRLVSWHNDQTPTTGGPSNRVVRLGSRWSADFETFPCEYADQGRVYVSRLVRGMTDTVLVRVPEPGVSQTGYGTPLVNGAGQAGSTLAIDGMPNGKVIPEGKFFSVIVSGQRYVYQTTAEVTVASGAATLPIYPILRTSPANNAVVELSNPMMEGFISGNEQAWEIARRQRIRLRFSVMERA